MKIGRECCEGVFRDLGFGFGNVSDRGGFADVGEAENTEASAGSLSSSRSRENVGRVRRVRQSRGLGVWR